MKTSVLFAIAPYAVVAMLAVGLMVRVALVRGRGKASAHLSDAFALYGGGWLWRIGLVLLGAIHVVGLVAPRALLVWNAVPKRLYLAEGVAFALGLAVLGGWVGVMERRSARSRASLADWIFLSLVGLGIMSGLAMAVSCRWASSWGAAILTPYVTSLFGGAPRTTLVDSMPPVVQLHVIAAFAALAILPFTRAASLLIGALRALLLAVSAPLLLVARAFLRWIDWEVASAWLWPEEECAPILIAAETAYVRHKSGIRRTSLRDPLPKASEQATGDSAPSETDEVAGGIGSKAS